MDIPGGAQGSIARPIRLTLVLLVLGLGIVAGHFLGRQQPLQMTGFDLRVQTDNEELRRLHDEDQRDRVSSDPNGIDWTVVARRDTARRERVKTLFAEGRLTSALDYYHAALVLQHGQAPEDFLLAHEFAVAAIVNGHGAAAGLAAATEDRFLTSLGRPQRFGTQFKADGDGPWRLEPVDPGVTDTLRKVMGTPPLAEAKARLMELNKAR